MSKAKQHIDNFSKAVSDVLSGKKTPEQAARAVKQSYKENVLDANDNAANNDKEIAMNTTTKETANKPAASKSAAPSRDQLIAAANDMNDKMGLDPAINVKLNSQAIVRDIMKNAHDLDHTDFNGSKKADEQITDDTKKTLKSLGFKVPAAPKAADDKKSDTKQSGASKPAASAPTKKAKSTSELKAEREAAKANKAPAAPKYTRTNAFIDAIKAKCKKKGANFDTIMTSVNEFYAKHGHDDASTNDNAKKSRLLMVLESLVAFDVLTLKDGVYSLKAE